jgi:hypothetical protein
MKFYLGLHHPSDARHVERAFISVNSLKRRRSVPAKGEWILDSGAFTTLALHGRYLSPAGDYAGLVRRFASPRLVAAVSQDFMCEPFMLAKTGMTVADHQRLTIERYDEIKSHDLGGVYLMPVLQGYQPEDYARHVRDYGDRLEAGAWVGVGSVCKRNGRPAAIAAGLKAILAERSDLKLHGFGVKRTSLADAAVVDRLHSADSMAWSFAARWEGRNRNDWREAVRYAARVMAQPVQTGLFA